MSFSDPTPIPEEWVSNPYVIQELNSLFSSFMNNQQDHSSVEDWECRVAQAMANSPPCPQPQSWIGCHDIVHHLNRVYRNIHYHRFANAPDNVDDWECHVADSMYDWAGMEKFFNLHQHEIIQQTPPRTPKQTRKRRSSPPPAPKKKVIKRTK